MQYHFLQAKHMHMLVPPNHVRLQYWDTLGFHNQQIREVF